MTRGVVITGLGVVSAAGIGIERTWRTIENAPPRAEVVELPSTHEKDRRVRLFLAPDYRIADITETCIDGVQLEREGIDQQRDIKHLIAAVGLAIDDADLRSTARLDLREIGLVVADEHPGIERLARTLYASVASATPPRPDYDELSEQIFALNTYLVPYLVARALHIGGECAFVNSACVSGLTAIDNAATQIRLGRSSLAIAAASDDPLSSGKFRWFADMHLYAIDGVPRPFHAEASGTVFGDGGAAVVLEDEEQARRRGARIYGRILGAGFTQDGWRINAPNPVGANQARSIRRALDEADLDTERIDAIVPHGTGIPMIDNYEAKTIRELWPDRRAQPVCLPLKPFVGHNLGGSSLLETALLLKAMKERRVPAVRAEDSAAVPAHGLDLPTTWSAKVIRHAVKTAVGFGGFYGTIVVEAM
ncbi:beta-ketoacyl synthase N-terminal-like domain-containing protein [Amycolatopsis sp. NPDC059021]|uniref:beta-ketoacyl synthase N-terminal-like domain-containing protein n=1 Tax=Amycolatopsis sp. NPDC059021 TaxID=3346704 RepID=UPI00366B5910